MSKEQQSNNSNAITPDHYKGNGCRDLINDTIQKAFGSNEYICMRAFYIGNIVKYIYRYQRKNGIEDLKKAYTYASYYLDTYIGTSEAIDFNLLGAAETEDQERGILIAMVIQSVQRTNRSTAPNITHIIKKLIDLETNANRD